MDTAVLIAVGLLALSNALAIVFMARSHAGLLTSVGEAQHKIYLFCASILNTASGLGVSNRDMSFIQDEMKKKGITQDPHERIQAEVDAVARALNMSRDEALQYISNQVKKT